MNVKVLKTAGLLLTGTAITVLSSCSGGQQQQAAAPEIATLTVAYGNAELKSDYAATVKGRTDIAIRPQVTGFITKVHVDEGDRVRSGQVLFTLDQIQYQAAVESAAAAVKVAESAVSTAQLTADNKKMLYDKNIISEYEWQMADNALAQAKAQLAQAEANLVNAKKNLAYTVVTAPCDGVIGTIPNREGSLASPSSAQALTTVSDNTEVYAYFSFNEKDLLGFTANGTKSVEEVIAGMPEVELQLADGTVYPIKGRVATISGVIDNTTGASNVRALFDNTNGMLRSGSTGTVLIPYTSDSTILIPQKATFEIQDRKYVYALNDSNKVSSRFIRVASENDGKNYIVTEGLVPGDRIAIEGVGTVVREGMVVTPRDAAAGQDAK
ncbi:MAG: efflux RND transporter periplasmic adaptor subunit [Muribaculaceae bacterium]|nr:efflux RND transporter periplasmic adaptor subunit [Muribaculaceae bacterium]